MHVCYIYVCIYIHTYNIRKLRIDAIIYKLHTTVDAGHMMCFVSCIYSLWLRPMANNISFLNSKHLLQRLREESTASWIRAYYIKH